MYISGSKRFSTLSDTQTPLLPIYFMLQKFFKNKNISKKLKFRLKNTIIDKVLTYVSETVALTKRDRKQLDVFERKVYRRILGPVYDNKKKTGGY